MSYTLYIGHRLRPHPSQLPHLDRQFEVSDLAWQALRARAALDRTDFDLDALLRDAERADATTCVLRDPPNRRGWLRDLARHHGWTHDVGSDVIDGVARAFGQVIGALEPGARLRDLPRAHPDEPLDVGNLARPLFDDAVELLGVEGLVPAAAYVWPVAADRVVRAWRAQSFDRLRDERADLERRLTTGDVDANVELLRHLARHPYEPPRVEEAATTAEGGVRLAWANRATLRRMPSPSGPIYHVSWGFEVLEVPEPRHPGMIGVDPGMLNLVTTAGEHVVSRVPTVLPAALRLDVPVPRAPGVRRTHDERVARLKRDAVLFRTVRPAFEAATSLLLDHEEVAIEDTDYAGFRRRESPYAEWADALGSKVYVRYAADLVRARGGRVELVDPRDTSTTCAACGTPGAMKYWAREGRCVCCGAREHRDVNAARVIRERARGTHAQRSR
ncbi:zinc ribbon domain-containing protein [Deinococcus yavapaiensis]|uniref:Putative transposase-like DNA-binding protein n=1 Tax=Deinococcus yavapaiensis KR-236 TaxID=694435 RepID=A0A318S5L1_9DEIO|nr:zinc ribbon domain-containing protein [Deinococcus yavapaiensis]PYE52983.1 putative transposase-like DNA-binding protein [Deinococcus yavapaiensis KR-236]